MIAAWILVALAFFALGILVYIAIRSRTRQVDWTAPRVFAAKSSRADFSLIEFTISEKISEVN